MRHVVMRSFLILFVFSWLSVEGGERYPWFSPNITINAKHIFTAETKGGYHRESPDSPVEVLISNPRTQVYGGFFFLHGCPKYSSFFPGYMTDEEVVAAIREALKTQNCRAAGKSVEPNVAKIIGKAGALYLEIFGTVSTVVTAFPVIAYVSSRAQGNDPVILDIKDNSVCALVRLEYAVAYLRRLASRQGARLEVRYGAIDVVDIAALLTGDSRARGVYIEMVRPGHR